MTQESCHLGEGLVVLEKGGHLWHTDMHDRFHAVVPLHSLLQHAVQ